ncbi:High-affinity branched-chain amino acid transport system permease protein LivH (TC 3.A.1.4.1) [Patulibacter medicamentivorans]|uniref:High-affinity branched-chain amino acid transport system permease protein LivH (TC 3.A.1.4.1) n=1 Tax=Patulibacter medicamentivorans TaxID=1097667 RepID=H0EBN2_9ACTN|nr:branched-chain amino acid ABC transporter permease [Patulibacter medicamentivorans]EHN08894.1 High-affinity branched-chain amino acid transport system permease protein LivH (TC 3.A.1.4.1) [Patulibacter medicamentivorans]
MSEVVATAGAPVADVDEDRRLRDRPLLITAAVLVAVSLALVLGEGLHAWGQASVNGLVSGSYVALGAVGLTLVYGTLKLTNFAHGDMLTFGAYAALLGKVTLGLPFVVAVAFGMLVSAVLGLLFELGMWRPMRRKGAGAFQLMLMSLGLAFVLRYGIQFVAGTENKNYGIDTTAVVTILDLRLARVELVVMIVGVVLILATAIILARTTLGRQMRALSDNSSLAETTGIDTGRIVSVTWLFAAGVAGLAGVLAAMAANSFTPEFGFRLLLSLFAAVILGGIGNAYGALVGGLLIGLVQEWSTLLVDANWKIAIGFSVLIIMLIVRPQGIFGTAGRV